MTSLPQECQDYEKAAKRFNAISETYSARRQELIDQVNALDTEYAEARELLSEHEDASGIPSCCRNVLHRRTP